MLYWLAPIDPPGFTLTPTMFKEGPFLNDQPTFPRSEKRFKTLGAIVAAQNN
jgi:hypothetical protein